MTLKEMAKLLAILALNDNLQNYEVKVEDTYWGEHEQLGGVNIKVSEKTIVISKHRD